MRLRGFIPPSWRWAIKRALIDFLLSGAASLADDPDVLARDRIKAVWHLHWLIRYDKRLLGIRRRSAP